MGKYKILVVDDEESLWLTAPNKRWRCIPNVIRCCCST